jgi:hypothetical protein
MKEVSKDCESALDRRRRGGGRHNIIMVLFVLVMLTMLMCPIRAFSTQTTYSVQPSSRLYLSPSDRDMEALARARNDARTDVRNLLTQRAIQSFMFLAENVRDPHSGKWIEDFLDTKNLLNYHGTGAGFIEKFGGTWDAPLLEMIKRDKDVVIVSAKRRGRGHGGWSKNNPYLEDRYVEFEIDIDPVSLASRILSVREQIAKEWLNDLDILAEANSKILDSYFKMSKEQRSKQDDDQADTTITTNDNTPPPAFERTAVHLLNNAEDLSPLQSSPFRKGNFDLLYSLCTQESVHRLLREFAETGAQKEVSFAWLRDFYTERVADYFDGDQRNGRADDFLEELLRTSPSVVITDDGKGGLADPLGLAEQIIETRNKVVEDWKVLMERVPQDHTAGIRKELLNKQMAAWGQGPPLGSSSDEFQ